MKKYPEKTIAKDLLKELEAFEGDPNNILLSRTCSHRSPFRSRSDDNNPILGVRYIDSGLGLFRFFRVRARKSPVYLSFPRWPEFTATLPKSTANRSFRRRRNRLRARTRKRTRPPHSSEHNFTLHRTHSSSANTLLPLCDVGE